MSKWTIYNKNGESKLQATGLEFHDTWMGEEFVTVNITSATPIDLEIGDYLIYRGLTYTIYSLPTALKQARSGSYGDAFKYDSVKFSARSTELTEIRFFDIVLKDNNLHYTSLPTFSFYAETVDDFLDRIQANINRDNAKPWFIISPSYSRTMQRYPLPESYSDPDYDKKLERHDAAEDLWESVFGETHTDNPASAARENEKTKVNISIDKQDIFNSLQHIKNSFGLNFITRERTIIVGHEGIVAAETYFQYGKDKGFYEIERTAEADQQIITKLFAYGSDKNIPTRYYAEYGKKHFVNASSPINPTTGLVVSLSFIPDIINSQNEEYYTVKSSEERTEPETAVDIKRIVTLECNGCTCRGFYHEYHNGQGHSGRDYRIQVACPLTGLEKDYIEPNFKKAMAFAQAVRGKTRVNIIEGIDKKIWPSNHVSYDTSMPNQMAVNVLMLPGFPEESLKTLCNVSYDASTNKTTISIRKNTESPYKPLMVLDGNQQIGFSEDRLMPYITSPNMDALGVKEGDIHFTEENDDNGLKEICPTVKGMTEDDVFFNGSDAPLDEIVACEIIKDDGAYKTEDPEYEFPDFHITIPNLGFNLYEAAKESGELTISLTDGYCGGRDFKVDVNEENIKQNDDGTWVLKVQRSPDDTLSLMFPYSDAASHGETPIADEPYQIRGKNVSEDGHGDHYVLSGIDIKETSYIWSASMEVLRKSITWLLNNDYTRFTYLPKIDDIYMARQNDEAIASHGAINSMHDTLKSGMLMWFEDEDLDFDGTIFIDTLTIKEDGNKGIPTYEVVLRNDKQVGTLQRVQNQVNSLTTFVNNGGGGMSSSQIRTLIRDYGVDYYLSKLVDDVAEGIIGFRKGLWVNTKGLFGIDEDGKTKVSDLHANGDVTIDNKLDVGGQATIDNIKSKNYSGGGIGDTGWSITNSNNGHSRLTIDELYVRMKAVFESLEVKERTYSGGDQIWSCAGNQIVRVDYLGNNESADHVPVMMQCRADGSPVSGGTAGEPVVSVPEVGETYGYSQVKVPWLLRGAAMILGRNNGLVQGLFSHYSKVRFVIGDEDVSSSRGNRSATVSDISKIRRARCYFLAKDGEREVKNWWRINDLARCQTMNLSNVTRQTYISGEDTKAGNIFWWRKVIGISYEPVQLDDGKLYHYFDVAFDYDLEKSSPETMATSVLEGSDIPAAGDAVVQFGNTIIEGRMNLMMMEVNGGDAVGYNPTTDAPCLKAYRGIYCFDLNKSWVGGKACKMKLSPKSGYEFYGPQFKQVTEYDVVPVPVERGLWPNITPTRDDYREHAMVRKCYYYDKVSHNGSYWLCSIVDGAHWVDSNGDYISDADYAALTEAQKALCSRKQNYTIEEPSANSTDWTEVVSKGDEGNGISRVTRTYGISAQGTTASETTAPSDISLWSNNSPAVTEKQPYLWAKEVVEYTRSAATTKYYMMGARGDNGVDAKDVEWVYIRTKTNTAPVILNDNTYVDTNGKDYTADDHLPQVSGNSNIENNNSKYQCTDDPKGVNDTWKYEWEIKRSKGDAVGGRRSWDCYQGTMTLHNNLAESAFILDLDNQADQFGTDSTGKVLVEQKRSTTATLYYGSQKLELTALAVSLKYEEGTNVASGVASVTADKTTGVVEVTIKANNIIGYAEIIASITATCARGSKTITFPIQKVMSGAPGVNPVIYQLAPTQKAFSFGRDANDNLTPTSVSSKINVAKTEGNTTNILSTAQTGITYSWGFENESSAASGHSGLAVGTNIPVSSTDAANHTSVWVKLSTGDRETLPITKDGAKGDAGDAAPYYVDDYGICASRTSHSDISSWSSSQPEPTAQKPYVWKRSRLYNPNTQTYGDATYVCLTGERGTNGKDGWMITADPANVIITQALGNDTTQFSTVKVGFTAKKGNVAATISSLAIPTGQQALSAEFNAAIGTGDDAKKVIVSSPKTYTPQGGTAQYYTDGTFVVDVIVTDPDTGSSVTFNVTVPCYANLLGTWKETVEAGEERIAAQKVSYALNNGDDTKNIDQSKATFNSVRNAAESYQEWARAGNTSAGSKTYINTHLATAEQNISTVKSEVESSNLLDYSEWYNTGEEAVNISSVDYEITCEPSQEEDDVDVYSQLFYLDAGTYTFSVFFMDSEQMSETPNEVYVYSSNEPFDAGEGDSVPLPLHSTSEGDGVFYREYGTFTLSGKKYVRINVYRFGKAVDFMKPMLHTGSTTSAAALLPYNPNLKIASASSIAQTAQNISLGVQTDIEGKLYNTGINIQGNNRTVDVQADNFSLHNNSGEKTMGVDAYGNMYIKGAIQYDDVDIVPVGGYVYPGQAIPLFWFNQEGKITKLPTSTIILNGEIGNLVKILLPPPIIERYNQETQENETIFSVIGMNIDLIIPARAISSPNGKIVLCVGKVIKDEDLESSGDYTPIHYAWPSDYDYDDGDVNPSFFWIADGPTGTTTSPYLNLSTYVSSMAGAAGYNTLRLCAGYLDNRPMWFVKSFTKYGNVTQNIGFYDPQQNHHLLKFNNGVLSEYIEN